MTDRVVPLAVATLDDEQLLQQLREGKAAAYRELFDRYIRMIRGVLRRMLGDSSDIDDLAQESLLIVVRRVEEIRDPGALRSFVYSVAVRVARNALRKRAARQWVRWSEAPPAAHVVAPHDAIGTDVVRRIFAVLDRMSPGLRIAFVLRFVEGLELAEGARAASCSLTTFKRRVSKAQARFESIARGDPVLIEQLQSRSRR